MDATPRPHTRRRRWTDRGVGALVALVLAAPAAAVAATGTNALTDLGGGATIVDSVTGEKRTLTIADGKLVVDAAPAPAPSTEPTAQPTSDPSTPAPVPSSTAPTGQPSSDPTAAGTVVTYGGKWEAAGRDRFTHAVGATLTVEFTGPRIALTGYRAEHHVNARVTVDGQAAGSTSSKGAPRAEVTILALDGLGEGRHKLVVTAAGTLSVTGAYTGTVPAPGASTGPTAQPTTSAPAPVPSSSAPTTSAPAPEPSTSAPAPVPGRIVPLSVKGNQIQAAGRDTWFLGYNSFTMGGGCGTAAEVAAARAQTKSFIDSMRHDGHGMLRLFYWSGYSAATKAALQDVVNYAGERNIYTVLTLSDGQKGCGNAGPGTLSANGYGHVKEAATRFKDNPAVAFFEVANEPTNGDWNAGYLDKVKGTRDTIKGIDPDRLVGSGNQAAYFLGGGDAESKRRQQAVNAVVDIASMHDYEGGCDASRTREELRLAGGKPMIMGEFGTLDSGAFNDRHKTFACKIETWAKYDGFAAALGWSWQPGNGGGNREYGNLDADEKTQRVLREGSLAG